MAKLLDIILDINFDNVCRLCLGQNGEMTNIYDANGQSLLTERILSLASVQILPDDGLPGSVCHSCREKLDKFIKFREQIENSYFVLCQCIGVDPNETDASYVQATAGPSAEETVYPTTKSKDKSPTKLPHNKNKQNPKEQRNEEVTNSLSSLFKDHLVSGISNVDLLVNPQDGYINVNYNSIAEDADVYKSNENYMSIALSQEDPQQINLLSKDMNSVLSGDNISDNYNIKLHDSSSDTKIYNISFSENNPDNSEALHDIFHVLETEEETQNGFDDITKFLKTSQSIDFKKLKEEIKIIKDKNGKNDCETEIDPDRLMEKLASRGVTFLMTEESLDKTADSRQIVTSEVSSVDEPENRPLAVSTNETNDVSDDLDKSDVETPDIIFAKMHSKDREVYTQALCQKEVAPRITMIYSIEIDPHDHSQIVEGKTENELLKFKTYMCHLCLMEFRECDASVLNTHTDHHFTYGKIPAFGILQHQPLFKCEFCKENFNDRYLFIVHQRKHLALKPFHCTICYKTFALIDKLSEHMANHAKASCEQHPCFCGKVFKKKQELLGHERSHVNSAPLVCTTCNKTFSNIVTLKMHRKRHTEGSTHVCDECDKSFFSNTQLKRHIQSHSGIRRFPCNFCSKAFYSNAERRRHLLYHFKTKKFKCEECDKAFYESGHLTIHMRTHTNFKPYVCDVCGKGFPTRVKLTRHLKMHKKHSSDQTQISDEPLNEEAVPSVVPKVSKTKVTPKFTKLNPASKKVSAANILGENSTNSNSLVSVDVLNNIGLENLPDDEEESYIIIEEDSNGMEVANETNGVQVFTDDNGGVFYVLDNEEFSFLNAECIDM